MITQINSISDVKVFARQIIEEGVSFHPDDDFNDYIFFSTKEPVYSPEEAAIRNNIMKQCFEYCTKNDLEIYEIMNVFENHSI